MRLTLLAAGGMLAITLATAAKAQPEHVWAEGFVPNLATQTELASATPEPRRDSRRGSGGHSPVHRLGSLTSRARQSMCGSRMRGCALISFSRSGFVFIPHSPAFDGMPA